MEIFLREILLVRVQYARAMHYTRAGNTKRAHKNTRARIIRCVDAEYSHHSSRDTRKLFAVNLVPTCVIKGVAREKRFRVNPGLFFSDVSSVRARTILHP